LTEIGVAEKIAAAMAAVPIKVNLRMLVLPADTAILLTMVRQSSF
jgi:hypothetical protein